MSGLRALLVLALVGGCGSAARAPEAPADGGTAWAALQARLPGAWLAVTPEGREIDVSFRAISNGSALLESFSAASGRETVTIYHPDGAALMLTHYCGQGNQATLRATEVGDRRIVFTLGSATDLGADEGVMSEMILELEGDGFVRTEVYRAPDGTLDRTPLRFRRAP